MIVWYRNIKMRDRDVEERDDLAAMVSSPNSYKFSHNLNIALNCIVFFTTLYFFQFNVFAHAIAFILLDFILSIVDYLVFTKIPSSHPANNDITAAQKRFKKMERRKAVLQEKVDCYPYGGWFYEKYRNELNWLNNTMETEEFFIKEELGKIKKQEIAENKRTSKDYSDKHDYFVALQEKLQYLINEKQYNFLKSVLNNVSSLMNLLEQKPIGYEMISHKLYLHLDELLIVLEKFSDLDDDLKQEYIDDIEKISVYLSKNIESISDRISEMETESIEISIAVLLKELSKEVEQDV